MNYEKECIPMDQRSSHIYACRMEMLQFIMAALIQQEISRQKKLESYMPKMREDNMKTSNFRNYGTGRGAVSISLRPPPWYRGGEYKKLAPSWDLLKAYMTSKINRCEYTERYLKEVLYGLNAREVVDELGIDSVLLCYEKPGEFCHRRIVANWIELALGIKVEEL